MIPTLSTCLLVYHLFTYLHDISYVLQAEIFNGCLVQFSFNFNLMCLVKLSGFVLGNFSLQVSVIGKLTRSN